jgi:hypothetical protein
MTILNGEMRPRFQPVQDFVRAWSVHSARRLLTGLARAARTDW